MAPRSSSTHNPSNVLNDVFGSFSKSVHQAFTTVEEKAKADVVRANTEVSEARRTADEARRLADEARRTADEARRERDEALRTLHDRELKLKDWQQRAETWNASVEKAELTIQHHLETIARLREEAQQWKDRLSRIEESSKREIKDWKEQYQRAEQERLRLSTRVEELVSEQLKFTTQFTTKSVTNTSQPSVAGPSSLPSKRTGSSLRTPVPKKQAVPKSNSSTTGDETLVESAIHPSAPTRRQRAAAREIAAAGPASKTPTRRARSASQPYEHKRKEESTSKSAWQWQQPRQTLIRRVHAIVEVPVKDEPMSDWDDLHSPSPSVDSEYERDYPQKPALVQRQRQQQQQPRKRSLLKSRTIIESESEEHSEDDEEEEDDQLLIGAEEDHNEVYGTHRVARPPPATVSKRPQRSLGNPSTGKKRKQDDDILVDRPAKVARRRH